MPDFAYDELRKKPALNPSVLKNSPRHRYLAAHAPTIFAALLEGDDTRWAMSNPKVRKVFHKKVRYAIYLTNHLYESILDIEDVDKDIKESVIGKNPNKKGSLDPDEFHYGMGDIQDYLS